jgi:hypothetical protein
VATTYRVVTKGVSAGRTVAEVAGLLSARFSLPADKVRAALGAPRFVLKQGLSLVDAAKYDQFLKEAGCRVIVEPEESPAGGHARRSTLGSAADTGGGATAGWRSALARAAEFFHSRVRPGLKTWSETWSASPPRQKALTMLLAAIGIAIVVLAVLLLWPEPGVRPAIVPATGETPSVPATGETPSAPAAVAIPATLVGAWHCSAEKSSGFAIRNTYVFRDDGSFEDHGTEVDFRGVYRKKQDSLVMTVRKARTGSTTLAPSHLVIDGTVTMLSASSMRLETVVRGSGERKIATCSRIPDQNMAR